MPRQITAEQANKAAYWLSLAYSSAIVGHALTSVTRGGNGSYYLDNLRTEFHRAAAELGFDLVERVTADEARALIPPSIGDIEILLTDAAGNVVGRG